MIINKIGNLLQATDIDAMAHVCNLFCTFGAGFALHLKNKHPETYLADSKTVVGDKAKLGKCSTALIGIMSGIKVYNMYCMIGIGTKTRQVHYEYLIECLQKVRDDMLKFNRKSLGIPYNMGCALAGGDWRIVSAIIESVFDNRGINVLVYKPNET